LQLDAGHLKGQRWLFITSHPEQARTFCIRRGLDAPMVISLVDGLRLGPRLRRYMEDRNIHGVAVYSQDLARQVMPQAIELLLASSGASDRLLIDGRSGCIERVGRLGWIGTVARLPVDFAQAAALTVRETQRTLLARSRGEDERPRADSRLDTSSPLVLRDSSRDCRTAASREKWILVVLPASRDLLVGGAVTHVSGILSGFRSAGYRVGLVVMTAVGDQIASVVDEIVVPSPLVRGARITRGMECLGMNEALRDAALDLGRRVLPTFVYQRHEYLSTAGADVAFALGVPLVLEWNASAVWAWRSMRRSSNVPKVVRASIRRFAGRFERRAVMNATLIAAVSRPAATMAFEAGAPRSSVAVVPNGVDLALIDLELARIGKRGRGSEPTSGSSHRPSPEVLVGWVGSFGPWHGTEMLIRALATLPAQISAVMIGTGPEFDSCRTLAAQLGVSGRIEFTGELPHSEAVRRLAQCDLLVSPHIDNFGRPFFGSPTKIFEYMAIGLPIVASRLEQIGEVLEDGVTARLVAPGDVPALAKAIVDTVESDDRGAQIGVNARRDAEENHTWERRAVVILDAIGAPRVATVRSSRPRSSKNRALG
jgi:glycosyltransferase involved in cell wall biosynthesis